VTSFAYNLGLGAFKVSTLRRKCQARAWREAGAQFLLWDKAGGVCCAAPRRRAENVRWRLRFLIVRVQARLEIADLDGGVQRQWIDRRFVAFNFKIDTTHFTANFRQQGTELNGSFGIFRKKGTDLAGIGEFAAIRFRDALLDVLDCFRWMHWFHFAIEKCGA
jgi:hypothetical protein